MVYVLSYLPLLYCVSSASLNRMLHHRADELADNELLLFRIFLGWNLASFSCIFVFFKRTLQILQQIGMRKMSIQNMVTEFKLTTFGT